MKIRGDKGHGSFKLTLQLVNALHPNSIKNTTLLSVFQADDNSANLHIALQMYKEHVKESQGMKVRSVKSRYHNVQ